MIKFLSNKLFKTCAVIAFASITTTIDAQIFNWSSAGPIYNAGRARNIIVDKSDPGGSILYVGSTSSGIFKSIDAGANWASLDNQGSVRNISYLAQANNADIFAGTGEGFLRLSQKAKALPGTGLYKLVGTSLMPIANATITGKVINKVACHPTLSNQLAIATDKGILISTDGGLSFSIAPNTPSIGVGLDIKFDLNGVLYASIGSEVASGTLGAIASTVWKGSTSDLTTANFLNITPSSQYVNGTNYGRIELATSPTNAGVIYVSCAAKYSGNASATLMGLFVSYDGGLNWGTILVGSPQLDPLFNGTTRASGDYAHTIVVDPSDYNKIYFGGYNFFTFVRTGGSNASPVGTWSQKGESFFANFQLYLHENIHDIKIVSGSPRKYYITTDAGIFRSIDMDNVLNIPPTFQPFYKGLVTGQFNSVSIERFPLGINTGTNAAFGSTITPYIGFLGGTGGNGATYFRGTYQNVNQEISSIGGDVFNCEFSKILPNAALLTTGAGALYRTSDVKTSTPSEVQFVRETSKQTVLPFDLSTYNVSGRPFKLWEYYGQGYKGNTLKSPDSLVFYNDTTVALSSIASLSATTNYTFTVGRPQPKAIIDYISVKMILVTVVGTPSVISIPSFSVVNTKTLGIQCSANYTVPTTGTILATIASVNGFTNATPLISNSVILNSSTNLDEIRVALAASLFTSQPSTVPSVTNAEIYVRLRATVFYRYDSLAPINILDDNISTYATTYSVNTKQKLYWSFPPINTNTLNVKTNAVQKYHPQKSSRLAIAYMDNARIGGVYVSKAPLDLNSPISLVKVSANKALTTNSLGVASSNTVAVIGNASILEWSKSGTELYYATDSNYVYRVSFLYTILDSTSKSYSGKLHTNIFTYSNTPAPPTYTAIAFNTPNPRSPYRTTLLGRFSKKVTSISIAANDSIMALTFDDPTGNTLVKINTIDIRKCDSTNVGFTNKTGNGLGNIIT